MLRRGAHLPTVLRSGAGARKPGTGESQTSTSDRLLQSLRSRASRAFGLRSRPRAAQPVRRRRCCQLREGCRRVISPQGRSSGLPGRLAGSGGFESSAARLRLGGGERPGQSASAGGLGTESARGKEDLGGEQSPWKDRAFLDRQRSGHATDSSAEQSLEVGCSVGRLASVGFGRHARTTPRRALERLRANPLRLVGRPRIEKARIGTVSSTHLGGCLARRSQDACVSAGQAGFGPPAFVSR